MLSYSEINLFRKLEPIHEVWIGIMSMDEVYLAESLRDDIDYEDIGKKEFVKLLTNRFWIHRKLGDLELLLDFDYCAGCQCGNVVCKFIGDQSGKHFALLFEWTEGEISDIYHCHLYEELITT